MTGLATAAEDAEEADDNMSETHDSSEKAKQEQEEIAWKKLISRLYRIPAKAHVKIRQTVVEAIAAARKAHQTPIVAELRSALLQFHPEAAGGCKSEALEILERHGGFVVDVDEEEDEEEEESEEQDDTPKVPEKAETGLASQLCAEAVILNSSLDGQEDASRADWIDAVKKTKTISKIASLTSAFVRKATEKLEKMEVESERLSEVMESWEKAAGRKKNATGANVRETSEVWANVHFTDEFCLAKVENYPWWPAKKCIPKEERVSSMLESSDRTLVSLVGESGGLRVVKKDDLLPFSETLPEEDFSNHSKEIRTQLEECMTMARRIIRGKEKKAARAAKKRKKSSTPGADNDFKEEKKLAT